MNIKKCPRKNISKNIKKNIKKGARGYTRRNPRDF